MEIFEIIKNCTNKIFVNVVEKMEKTLTKMILNSLSKEEILQLILQLSDNIQYLSEQNSKIKKQNEQLIGEFESIQEEIEILTQKRFR